MQYGDAVVSDQLSPSIVNYGKNTLLENLEMDYLTPEVGFSNFLRLN